MLSISNHNFFCRDFMVSFIAQPHRVLLALEIVSNILLLQPSRIQIVIIRFDFNFVSFDLTGLVAVTIAVEDNHCDRRECVWIYARLLHPFLLRALT